MANFHTNVFVNCPFDDKYLALLRPLLFTTLYLGLTPRIALERSDSGEARVEKILELVGESKFAIHDLSRLKSTSADEYFRLNMPFELGLDVGCRRFGTPDHRLKRCLILESERYRFQAALSDLAGCDIAVHGDEPEDVVREVRNWLVGACGVEAPGPAAVWGRFCDFMADNFDHLTARGYSKRDVELLPIGELIDSINRWMARTS